MKTAVIFSGQIRTAKKNYLSIKNNIIDKYNADVFIDTWCPKNNIIDHRGKILPNDSTIDELIDLYEPKLLMVEDFNKSPIVSNIINLVNNENYIKQGYDTSFAWETKPVNVFIMHYKINRANKLRNQFQVMSGFKYDCIIRIRFDLEVDYFPTIIPQKNTIYIPKGWNHRGGVSDLMFLGDDESANIYCNLINELPKLCKKYGIHPESILRRYLEESNLNIQRFETSCRLRGELISSYE